MLHRLVCVARHVGRWLRSHRLYTVTDGTLYACKAAIGTCLCSLILCQQAPHPRQLSPCGSPCCPQVYGPDMLRMLEHEHGEGFTLHVRLTGLPICDTIRDLR